MKIFDQNSAGGTATSTGAIKIASGLFRYAADQFLNIDPVGSDWAVNVPAQTSPDPDNPAISNVDFDDTTEQGKGMQETIPVGATNIVFTFKSKAKSIPGGAVAVVPKLYVRSILDNTAVGAWSAGTDLTVIDLPASTLRQYDTQTIALSTLGLVAGNMYQFELTRNTGSGSDTLVGHWSLTVVEISFS